MDLEAEKIRFKMVIGLIDQMQTIPFESETGKSLQRNMKEVYSEIVRPFIVIKMNELVKIEK